MYLCVCVCVSAHENLYETYLCAWLALIPIKSAFPGKDWQLVPTLYPLFSCSCDCSHAGGPTPDCIVSHGLLFSCDCVHVLWG